jgi:hypothetical protein
MNTSGGSIEVRSHVARDLLQNAALFKTDKLVVWEYVSNGLQYVDPGTNPTVRVSLDGRKKRIVIADNGRGMDWLGLQGFFVMHGENADRREGKAGRGRFGTGKSAAFGIGDCLQVTTVRNGRRSKVALHRSEVQEVRSGDAIPVKVIERESRTQEPSGTITEIEDIHLKSLDQAGIIRYVERHLVRWPKNCTVFVNNHECEFIEPPLAFERRYPTEGQVRDRLGDVELVLKVAKAPLEEDFRGVAIFSRGVWHETTLAGNEGRDMAHYIFGEIDVPTLDSDDSPIPPFDLSRSMRLNPQNEMVQVLYGFIGPNIDLLRRELVESDRNRKASEEARRLDAQAAEIAAIINGDFDEYRRRLAKVKATAPGGADIFRAKADVGVGDDDLVSGGEIPADALDIPELPPSKGNREDGGCAFPSISAVKQGTAESQKKGRPAGNGNGTRSSGGGFNVRFECMGGEAFRATYLPQERSIYINLDHPQIAAARQMRSTDDPTFRRLAYEVAFSEYAVALASELAANDEYLDPSDPIVDIRECLNRLARKAAKLYAAS